MFLFGWKVPATFDVDFFICKESKRSPLPEHRGCSFLTAPGIFQIALQPRPLFLFGFLPFSLFPALLLPRNLFFFSFCHVSYEHAAKGEDFGQQQVQQEQREAQELLVKTGLQEVRLLNLGNVGKFLLDLPTPTLIFNRVAKGTFSMKKLSPAKCRGPFAESGASRTSVRKDKCFEYLNKNIFFSGWAPSWTILLEFLH